MAKKKKISKKEKEILKEIRREQYQLRKIKKEYEEFKKENPKDNKKAIYQGEQKNRYSKNWLTKNAKNDIINRASKINNKIYEAKEKLKVVRKTKAEKITAKGMPVKAYNHWEINDFNKQVLDDKAVKTINGISVKTDKDTINNMVEDMRLNMSSKNFIKVWKDEQSGNAIIKLIGEDDL